MQETSYFVGVKFTETGKAYYFSTQFEDLQIGDLVVVDTVSGTEMGTISTKLMDASNYHNGLELKPILRKPTKDDLNDYEFNKEESKKALKITNNYIKELGLNMNLLEANYTLDGSKITITYTADERVDFRELLKLLAPQLHCRIELRQIAARDKAKLIGGLGSCGLPLCCSTFLDTFDGISISRAKNQMLSLNIPKLSGACGKLMCCLLFEDEMYTKAKAEFPRFGQVVKIEGTDYTVSGMNILSKQIKLNGEESTLFLPLEDVLSYMKGIKPKKKEEDDLSSFVPTFKGEPITEEKKKEEAPMNRPVNNNPNRNNNPRDNHNNNPHQNNNGANHPNRNNQGHNNHHRFHGHNHNNRSNNNPRPNQNNGNNNK